MAMPNSGNYHNGMRFSLKFLILLTLLVAIGVSFIPVLSSLRHADAKTDAKTHLAFCLYWKSSLPLHATDRVLATLPIDANDPDQVQRDPDTGLFRVTPPARSETESGSE